LASDAEERIDRLSREIQEGKQPEGARPEAQDDLKWVDYAQDIKLKRRYANGLLTLLAAQIVIANVLVYLYAGIGRSWDVPTGVMQAWLAATVIELIGVVAVVTRYLFPRRS